MQDFNFHTHTKRCNHALGDDEAFINEAIKVGLKTIGFSDHVPYPKDNGGNSRMLYEECDEYLNTMRKLKYKYKDQIDIKIGFECEYLEELEDYYRELKNKCDYLILGQHMGKFSNLADYFYNFNKDDYKDYERLVIKGIKSGLFSYLCHPDVVLNSLNSTNDELMKVFENIFKVAKEYDFPIEINFGGLNKKQHLIDNEMIYPYPNRKVIALAAKIGCDFIYGADAHSVSDITNFYKRIEFVNKNILKDIKFSIKEDFKIC